MRYKGFPRNNDNDWIPYLSPRSKDTTKRMSAELRVVQLVEQVDAERNAAANERQAAQEAKKDLALS